MLREPFVPPSHGHSRVSPITMSTRLEGDVEFFGEHLSQGGRVRLAHLDLAGIARDAAVLADLQVGVEVGGILALPAPFLPEREDVLDAKEDEDAAAGELHELAPIQISM